MSDSIHIEAPIDTISYEASLKYYQSLRDVLAYDYDYYQAFI